MRVLSQSRDGLPFGWQCQFGTRYCTLGKFGEMQSNVDVNMNVIAQAAVVD